MNTAYFIARRYLFSRKKKNFINILSIISVIGVAVGTAALVIVLSVFNGLQDLTVGLYAAHNPEIRIEAAEGKSFAVNDSLRQLIGGTPGVKALTEVMEDHALVRYGHAQMTVMVKGVSDNFYEQYPVSEKLVNGKFLLMDGNTPYALLGFGVQMQLAVDVNDRAQALVFWYPKKGRAISMTDPTRAFNQRPLLPGGVLAIEQQFDNNYIVVPLAWANLLMQYGERRTALEVRTTDRAQLLAVQARLRQRLGSGYTIKTLEEQQESILRAVKVERLFVFIALSFVLAVASFNIFFSLTMLAIEKRRDIAVLCALGAGRRLVVRIFLIEGMMIALAGAAIGLALGFGVCFLQQQYGLVGLGVESSVVQAYPVRMALTDFAYIALTVLAITLLASLVPARSAAQVRISEQV